MSNTLLEAMAKAIYNSSEFVKPWNHPDTIRRWHPVCLRQAKAALEAHDLWRPPYIIPSSQRASVDSRLGEE